MMLIKILFSLYPFIREIYFKDKSFLMVLRETPLKVIFFLLLIVALITSTYIAIDFGRNNHVLGLEYIKLKNATKDYAEYQNTIKELNQQVREYAFENNQLRLKNCSDFGDIKEDNNQTLKEDNNQTLKEGTVYRAKPIVIQKDITNRDVLIQAFNYTP